MATTNLPCAATQVACIGATPWVVNYNILLEPAAAAAGGGGRGEGGEAAAAAAAAELLAEAKRIARAVSERGGGLEAVRSHVPFFRHAWRPAKRRSDSNERTETKTLIPRA